MKTVSAMTMHELDKQTVRNGHRTGMELMWAAGTALFRAVEKFFPGNSVVSILAGKGNNGGDGFILASLLSARGRKVRVFCPAEGSALKGDALTAYNDMPEKLKAGIRDFCSPEELAGSGVIVDAMLGTGFSGDVRHPLSDWIRIVNESNIPVLSVDVPSGLNATDGTVGGIAVSADITVTFALPKTGLLIGEGPALCGHLEVANIGIPRSITDEADGSIEMITEEDAGIFFGREKPDICKFDRGHVLVIGGSADYAGAPLLAGEAALRTGAGLVTVLLPDCAEPLCKISRALIVRRLPSKNGVFSEEGLKTVEAMASRIDSVVIGPGMSNSPDLDPFLAGLLKLFKVPVLLDADGLNRAAANPALAKLIQKRPAGMTVLTPHEGEMKRLMDGMKFKYAGLDRIDRASRMAQHTGSITVLKGPHTLTASARGQVAMNQAVSTVLATAGSGDLLSGIIAALLARKHDPFEAAKAGVFIHGLTGAFAAHPPYCGRGVIADDLLEQIRNALQKISCFA